MSLSRFIFWENILLGNTERYRLPCLNVCFLIVFPSQTYLNIHFLAITFSNVNDCTTVLPIFIKWFIISIYFLFCLVISIMLKYLPEMMILFYIGSHAFYMSIWFKKKNDPSHFAFQQEIALSSSQQEQVSYLISFYLLYEFKIYS